MKRQLIQFLRQSAQALKTTNPLAARSCTEAALEIEDLRIKINRLEREVEKWKSQAKDLSDRFARQIGV